MFCRYSLVAGVLIAVLTLGCGDDEEVGPATAEELVDVLASATSGEVVQLAVTTYRGSFVVPAGVTVEGNGATVIAEGGAAFRLIGGTAEPTRLTGVVIRTGSSGGVASVGLLATGTGSVRIESSRLEIDRGVGMIAEGLTLLTLQDVDVQGPLTDDLLETLVEEGTDSFSTARTAVLGVAISAGVATDMRVEIEGLTVSDFLGYGVAFLGVQGSWVGGTVTGCAGNSVVLQDSEMDWEDVTVAAGRGSAASGVFAVNYGVVLIDGSALRTENLQVAGIDGIGLFQAASTSAHAGALIMANEGPGAWVQQVESVDDAPEIQFSRSVFMSNRGAGIQLIDSADATITDSVLCDTRMGVLVNRPTARELVGDAIQIVTTGDTSGRPSTVNLANTAVFGNGRAGLLLAGQDSELSLGGSQNVVCGAGEVEPGWNCSVGSGSELECIRDGAPQVASGWTCSNEPGGTVCTTTDAVLIGTRPVALVDETGFIPAHCRGRVDSLVGASGLRLDGVITGTGGFESDVRSLVDETGFSCANEGDSWRCTIRDSSFDTRGDADNPSLTDGPGWSCHNESNQRRCAYEGFGLVTADSTLPEGATDLVDDRFSGYLRDRDQQVREGSLQAPQEDAFFATVPRLVSEGQQLVGENGIVGASGVLTENQQVDPRGLVDETGF